MGYKVIKEVDAETGEEIVAPEDIRFGAQGLFLGYGEEVEAGLRTGFGLLGDYEKTRDELRERLARARERYPVRSAAAEIGGAVAPSLALGPLAGAAATGRAALGRMALGGAAEGAVYGTGVSEREGLERVLDAPASAAVGAVAAPVGGMVGRAVGGSLSGLVDRAKRRFGERASKTVEAEFQRIMQDSGMSFDDIIDSSRRGMTPADMSETARKELSAYVEYVDDAARKRMQETRPKELREAAFGKAQSALATGGNVLAEVQKGAKAAKKSASQSYDEIFDTAPDLPESFAEVAQRALNEAPEATSELKKVMKDDLFSVGGKGLIKMNRVPTLREAEAIRRSIKNKSRAFYKSDMPLAGDKYDKVEKELRSLIDEASPELSETRSLWSSIVSNAEHFDAGRKVFGKPADEIEIAFEEISEQGDEALASFRAGLADAIRRKRGTGSGMSLPRVLGDMERKEAQIFKTIFPEDSYEETMQAMDLAARAQQTKQAFAGSPTSERDARRARQGMLSFFTDLAQVKAFSDPLAAGRLMGRAVRGVGQKLSDADKRKVASLLVEENPELVEAALKDKGAFAALQGAAIKAARAIEAGGLGAGGVGAPSAFEAMQEQNVGN
jgi:hypothetical protein